MSYILRCDDCGWEPTKKNPDRGLEWFRQYREAGGFEGLPVVWAFIPTTVGSEELRLLHFNLHGEERLAVHGWDHADGATVERRHMNDGKNRLESAQASLVDCYVPPFNRYDKQTISDWGSLHTEDAYFFGGFNGEHHAEGATPTRIGKNVIHLPATKELYGRAHEVLDALPRYRGLHCPIVVTLHVTWDIHGFRGLHDLRDAIKNELVSPDEASRWLKRASFTLDELTAPHYAAYKWITDRIPIGARVLDVGSRYSKLPNLMGLRGARVDACDRDFETLKDHLWTSGACVEGGFGWDCVDPFPDRMGHLYDTISACWAIQHNFPIDRQKTIMRNLNGALKSGGQLLVVSSFSSDKSFEQMNRKDPQLVLNVAGHDELIASSGMRLAERSYFRYEHQSSDYKWCSASEANATAYRLVKD